MVHGLLNIILFLSTVTLIHSQLTHSLHLLSSRAPWCSLSAPGDHEAALELPGALGPPCGHFGRSSFFNIWQHPRPLAAPVDI